MQAGFLPLMQDAKHKVHYLPIDSALNDKVQRKNAYEERLLVKRTEHIEKQRHQTLDEYDFRKSQFLSRFLPTVERLAVLRKDWLTATFDIEKNKNKQSCTRSASNSPIASCGRDTKTQLRTNHNLRRTLSCEELKLPDLECIEDILNGYRSREQQTKSVSPMKRQFAFYWNMENNDIMCKQDMKTTLTANDSLQEKYSTNKIEQMSDPKSRYNSSPFSSTSKNEDKFPNKINHLKNDKTTQNLLTSRTVDRNTVSCNVDDNEFTAMSNTYEVRKKDVGRKQGALPENFINNFLSSLKNDATPSNASRFLVKMLKKTEECTTTGVINSDNYLTIQSHNSPETRLMSNVKKRQLLETQRVRILRSIILVYDTICKERKGS